MKAAFAGVIALIAAWTLASTSAQAANPSALWEIVNGKCVPDEQAQRDPSPCSLVDLANGEAKGYVVLKDRDGATQFLLIPTARISGIEDPQILDPEATNYFDEAWQERYFVEERLGTPVPRNAMTLAINSVTGRSQNQLHIHIDCIRPDVKAILDANLDKVQGVWTPFPIPLLGHTYRSIRINSDTLSDTNPFRVLADQDPSASADMGHHTLVVVGANFPDTGDGFVLLDDKTDIAKGDFASGEELQDHGCKIMQKG